MELEGSLLYSQELSTTYYLFKIHFTINLLIYAYVTKLYLLPKNKNCMRLMSAGARGGAVGCGTELQAGKSRVRFTMVSMEFFTALIFPAGSTKPLTDVSISNTTWGVKAVGV
jgi:hypothetical protein